MFRKIKEFREVWRIWKVLKHRPYIFNVVEDILKLCENTSDSEKPMASKIVLLNMKDGTKITDFVSLWAGIGNDNPVDRCVHLKNQNTELKNILQMYVDGKQMTESELFQVKMILKVFE